MRYPARRALLTTMLIVLLDGGMPAQLPGFVPVGARYHVSGDEAQRRRDLEEMQRLRFNVVAPMRGSQTDPLSFIDRQLASAPFPGVPQPHPSPALIPAAGGAEAITLEAWSALARGARGFLFDDWAALRRNPAALTAAAEFAEAVTRNAALYAALRPRPADPDAPDVRVEGAHVEAHLLESSDAILLVAINRSPAPQTATLAFSTDIPEAIWRNMLTGASVTFVTGSRGPAYPRTFAPSEVVVLVINKGRV